MAELMAELLIGQSKKNPLAVEDSASQSSIREGLSSDLHGFHSYMLYQSLKFVHIVVGTVHFRLHHKLNIVSATTKSATPHSKIESG